ncbi:MAG: type I DNA topoisomerase [Candidatus Paceibacterota bacterium]
MKLLIVESPAKAGTIAKYLKHDYTVKSSVGHIRDLPKSNKNAIDIEAGFAPHYEIPAGKKKVVADLTQAAGRADEVLLATDPDREGEAIAWHLKEVLGLKKPKRIVFHEITEGAVTEAMKHPRLIDEHLRQAQEARRVLDRLFGYDLSGLIWKKLRYGLSAGRVQSPALRLLVEREKEIRAFRPVPFWVISAKLATKKNEEIIFTCQQEPASEAEAAKITAAAKAGDWSITAVKESEVNRRARAPFTTSTLQQAASSRLGLSPSNTMRLAQKLYEAGHITYMRTDSVNLSEQSLSQAEKIIVAKYGATYHRRQQYARQTKNAQEAHEAIRPSNLGNDRAGRGEAEKKLYQLIWQRTVASQMAPAKTMKTRLTAGQPDLPPFHAHGSRILFDGWLRADPRARGEDVELPKVAVDDPLTLLDIVSDGRETQPPNRYSEAGLVRELEKRGIGRPSTYAPTIKTIIDRGYVEKNGRTLFPTDTGEVVSDFLVEHFPTYISDSFTAKMEDELDEIARGEDTYLKTLTDFYGPFRKAIAAKKDLPKISTLGDAPAENKCPVCGGPMVIKLAKNGKFYSCAKFPDCDGALTIEGKVLAAPQATGEKCPDCRAGQLIEREGKFGKFIACDRYPKCKFIKNDTEAGDNPGNTGVPCPICHQGTMVEKRGRFGVFYGCSHYPNCKHIIKTKPTGDICHYPRETGPCPQLLMAGTKTIPVRCSDKTCPNHRPDKLAKENKKSEEKLGTN